MKKYHRFGYRLTPYYIQAEDRIRELAEAIIRNPNCDRVKEWAVEIALQKELIDRMKEK